MKVSRTTVLARAGIAGVIGLNVTASPTTALGREAHAISRRGAQASEHYYTPASRRADTLKRRFDRLADEWRADTRFTSSLSKIYGHPAYQEIISLGRPVLPLILASLKRYPQQWFAALEAITGENPVEESDAGNVERMRAAWIEWGKQRDLL
jgi:hypothetical protein